MSITPRVANETERVNDYTVITDRGATDGVQNGERVLVAVAEKDGEDHVVGTVVDTGERRSVVELRR